MDRDFAYEAGYRHGSFGGKPQPGRTEKSYLHGYIRGREIHNELLMADEEEIAIPKWMTPLQVEAVKGMYRRNPDGAANLRYFFKRVNWEDTGSYNYGSLNWRGMIITIERDGTAYS
jgi:hypothetical protein